MKWYSTKEYKPALNGMYLVRLKHSINESYEVASFEWIDKYFDCGYEITHFCIPDPIPIEE